MPELPEVESARAVLERAALGRRIAEVDDTMQRATIGTRTTWFCSQEQHA